MTTTELIALLKIYEFGGASGRPREISFNYRGLLIFEPAISIDSTGDGLFAEICFTLDADKPTTIADCIRASDDEDLAKMMTKCPGDPPKCLHDWHCDECWLEYLRSPVEARTRLPLMAIDGAPTPRKHPHEDIYQEPLWTPLPEPPEEIGG